MPRTLLASGVLILTLAAGACGGGGGAGPLPKQIVHVQPGQTIDMGTCGSWISPGIAAAYCAAGIEAPAPAGYDSHIGQVTFTGTPHAGAEGGIAQAAGRLPIGRSIGIKVDSATDGTIVAQGICGHTLVRGAFLGVRFRAGDRADLRVTRVGETPVILLRRNGRDIAPDQESLQDLTWMPNEVPNGCGFRVG
jgi:hypothetical protein